MCKVNGDFVDIKYTFDATAERSYNDFSITYNSESDAAEVISPTEGTYTVVFAAYSGEELTDVSVVNNVEFKSVDLGKVKSVAVPEDFAAGAADKVKVMLWKDLESMIPKCAADTKTIK